MRPGARRTEGRRFAALIALCALQVRVGAEAQAAPRASQYSPVTLGLGFGSGALVNAGDQRRYVEAQSGDGDTVLGDRSYHLLVSPTYAPFRHLRLAGLTDLALAPFAPLGDASVLYYTRASVGALALLEFPLTNADRLVAIDLGGGPLYHWIGFSGHRGEALGVRAQVAFVVAMGQSSFGEIAIGYDHVPAVSNQDPEFALDYSALLLNGAIHLGFGQR